MERPDYVTCVLIEDSEPRRLWCGRDPGTLFVFSNVDEALSNGVNGGPYVVCKKCTDAIDKALRYRQDEVAKLPFDRRDA